MELDTFDDGPYTEGPEEGMEASLEEENVETEEASEEQSTEEESVQTDEEETFDDDSQVSLLDEKEEKREETAEKKDDKGDEEDKESDEDAKSDESEEDDAAEDARSTEEEIRNIKAFRNGKMYEVPEDATFKTKVNGKWETPTLQELKDDYSGRVMWDRKFTELSEDKKEWSEEKEAYEQEIDLIRSHMVNISELVKSAMQGEGSHNAPMEYLLDLMGADTLNYSKAMYNSQAEEFDLYSQMTESERDAYWTKKENAYLTKRHESSMKRQADVKTQEENAQRIHSLREAHGISEEAYVSASKDLEAEGVENITPEQIVKAAKLTPLVSTSYELLEEYADQMSTDELNEMAAEIATTMYETPDISVDQVKKVLAEQFKVEELVSTLEKKTAQKEQISNVMPKKKADHLESFDDFDY